VIVGTGQAGFQTAVSLREHGYAGSITLVGDEPHLPYQRPPLSKSYLIDGSAVDALSLRHKPFYESNGLQLRVGDPAIAVNRAERRLILKSGAKLDYDQLVLALGARPRSLPIFTANLRGVLTLRTIADADELRRELVAPKNILIVGGGFIGMEIAAAAASTGHRVTVIETMHRVMARVVTPEISDYVSKMHASRGTSILTDRSAVVLYGVDGRVSSVELDDGMVLPADVVLVGIGVKPHTSLAEDAGLPVDNGVIVDEELVTIDPRISAIGDCANFPSVHARGRARLESVQNAVDQGKHVAARLAGRARRRYAAVPWFWTHQYDMVIQTAGIGHADDKRVVHGDPKSGHFSVLQFRNDALTCVESVNSAVDHMAARRLLAGDLVGPEVTQVLQPGFSLKQFAKDARAATVAG